MCGSKSYHFCPPLRIFMDQPDAEKKFPQLLQREIAELNQDQIDLFSFKKIHAKSASIFDAQNAVNILKDKVGSKVLGIDIGGDKLLAQSYTVTPEGLSVDELYHEKQKIQDGAGYLESLEKAALFTREQSIPAGISVGLPLEGTKPPRDSDKLSALVDGLNSKYDGDFSKLPFDKLVCLNDAPAGLISGALHANLIFKDINTVIYIINGGGIGAAVLKDNAITATEAGHIEVIADLNKYQVQHECGVFGAKYVCLESVASNKSGIEQIWHQETGSAIAALEIEKRFTENQPDGNFALELYDYSAYVLAHVIKGLAKSLDIDLKNPSVAVVGHGGAFKFPNYGARIAQILESNGEKTNLILTKDFSDNACAEGAAIAALAS
jgi:predicted NBD/HSP70 family sugar kinase